MARRSRQALPKRRFSRVRRTNVESGSAVPMVLNFSTFHTFLLYHGSEYTFKQIFRGFTDVLDVRNPGKRATGQGGACGGGGGGDGDFDGWLSEDTDECFASLAAGIVRDAAVVRLWLWTKIGQLGLEELSDEE